MGWVLYRMGRLDEALKYLRQAHEALLDDEIAAHYGEVLWKAGQHEEAERVWTRALEQSPESEHIREVRERLKK
jgi:tetratricopeptide (TPR) repeat protein